MSVHNDPGHDLCSVLNHYLQQTRTSFSIPIASLREYGLHAVHRLDKETSGLILLAGQPEIFHHFAQQFARRHVVKSYLALVHGNVSLKPGPGQWQWSLTPRAGGRRNPQGQGKRKNSITRYVVLRQSPHYALLDCQPLTGRTHQIRRHAALAGHPLAGDQRYGSLRACRFLAQHKNFNRLALHAHRLTLRPPDAQENVTFESLGLPSAIQGLMDNDC